MGSSSASEDALDRYHAYLQKYYEGGCERFFSPTGFLEKFQKTIQVETQKARNLVFAKSVDEAEKLLEPAVAGSQEVFDLTAEPGTGKTSVLPFRFPSKKVVVALPSPFDAWSAYQMATGRCMLKFKGLTLGDSGASVIFTDSYYAARALLSGYLDYDILIVDECDSHRGVTKFLSEVKAPGKLLIRMSASYGRTESGPSRSFNVGYAEDLPDVRHDSTALISYVNAHHKGRSLLLVPDADTAMDLGTRLGNCKVVCSKSSLGAISRAVKDQESACLFVSDDICARGLNLNLDTLFDCQLVAENGLVRPITPEESYQRRGRVGRNKSGWYRSSGIVPKDRKPSDIDIVRNNVVRGFAGINQEGDDRLRLSTKEISEMLDAHREPYVELMSARAKDTAIASSSSSSRIGSSPSVRSARSSRSGSKGSFEETTVSAPKWLFALTGGATATVASKDGRSNSVSKYVVKRADNYAFVRRRSSGSDEAKFSDDGSDPSTRDLIPSPPHETRRHRRRHEGSRALLPVAEAAPYAAEPRRQVSRMKPLNVPMAPPVMDLTLLTYDLDWPSLIRDRLVSGGDLPTLVPPNSWRHTSVGGVGTNWLKRLDDVAVGELSFSESELEVVCRAWNRLVAQSWVRRSPGLSDASLFDSLEFCARYFQSHYQLASAD